MKKIIRFLVITFVFSWFFWGLRLLAQAEILPSYFVFLGNVGVFGPFIAYILEIKVFKENNTVHFKSDVPKWIYYFVFIIPFILSSLSYILMILIKGNSFELGLSIQMIVPVALIILITGGPLEEFGWRGYLLPLLKDRYNFLLVALIIGLIHGLWHIPLHFTEGTVQINIPILEFVLITILNSIIFSFLYEQSTNIKPLIILHWMSNLSSAIFMYWTNTTGRYLLFGFTSIVVVIMFLINRKKKELIYERVKC